MTTALTAAPRATALRARLLVAAALAAPTLGSAQGSSTGVGVAPSGAVSSTLSPVQVRSAEAEPARQRASVGASSDAPLAETPQSISVIRAETLRDAGATGLSSAIRSESSLTDFYNTLGYVESLQIRGFLLDNALNYRRDGLPISNHAPFALENKQAVEVLKGVAGIQSGLASPGGLVNYVLKRPTVQPLRDLFVGLSERGTTLLHGDIGGRAGVDSAFGYRINAAVEERRPEVRNAPGGREFVSGFFDWRWGAGWLAEAEFESLTSRQISVPGFGLLSRTGDGRADLLPAPVDPRLNANSQPWSQPFDSRSLVGSLRLQKLLANDWIASLRWGSQRIRTNDRLAFPDQCTSLSPDWSYPYACPGYNTDLYDYRSDSERRTMRTAELALRGEITAAGLRHELNASVLKSDYDERYDATQVYDLVGQINVLQPSALAQSASPYREPNTLRSLRRTDTQLTDVIRLGEAWSLWLGLRHTALNSSSERADPADRRAVAYSQQFTTPWGALGYKPWAGGFVYVSAGQGVESAAVPNRPTRFANAGEVLPALRSHQRELGLRQQLSGGALVSASLFEIERPLPGNIEQIDGLKLQLAGAREARHRGLELAYTGRIARDWTLAAQATALDARTTRSPDPSEIGARTRNTAPLQLAANLGWHLPQVSGLAWQNRLMWSGRKAVTGDGAVELPAWWQLDTALVWRQRQGARPLTWRAGVDNVFDRRYWRDAPTQYWDASYLFPAPPRTVRLSLQAGF
jgi:iron complex outermembrane receptor protein